MMKKILSLLFAVQLLVLSFNQIALSQSPVVENVFSMDKTENISADELRKLEKGEFHTQGKIDDLSSPSLTQINFDDLQFSNVNSISISPNRYAGVSFYSPYANNTWLTWGYRYSLPNSLIVGNSAPFPDPDGNTYIHSVDVMVIEFAQPSKDVAFLWGNSHGYYNSGQVQIINENNQIVANIPVTVSAGSWTSISLNQFSQRIKKVALIRPPVSNTRFGHIHLDNLQFTPVTTSSPIGYLDGVNIQQAAALGWSLDPDNPSANNFVDCYVDGTGSANLIGRVPANYADHRFVMPIPIRYRDGENHQIRCWGLDVTGGDAPTLLTGSPKTFKFNAPIGHFDLVTTPEGDAVGWSLDPDLPDQPNTVHFYINAPAGSPGSVLIGGTVANRDRSDVGNHGFSFSIPAQYRDNVSRTIYAYGLDLTGDNSKPLGGNPKTFTLEPSLTITNPRVGGDLSNTTQYALLGGDITLTANAGNGKYEWTITGPYTIIDGTLNSPTITIRSIDENPISASIRFESNNTTVTRSLNITIVTPTLNSYSAQQKLSVIARESMCDPFEEIEFEYAWSLGCRALNDPGIVFSASAEIPANNYLTDPSKSGIKYVQSVSTLRKRIEPNGSWSCNTARDSEEDTNSGWMLDKADPSETRPETLKYFSEGNLLQITNNDSPAQAIIDSRNDAIKIDDHFETYIVYFSGGTPGNPNYQKRLGSLSWNWGGLANYKYPFGGGPFAAPYERQATYGSAGSKDRDASVSLRNYDPTPVQTLNFVECRAVTSLVDGSAFFVSQQYRDFLVRQPSDNERESGRFRIALCAFNTDCISQTQAVISREFFRHPDFVVNHPELDPNNEGTHAFNVEFVRWSYFIYLQSVCEPAVCDQQKFEELVAYLDATGDYVGVVNTFINTPNYKNRFPLPTP